MSEFDEFTVEGTQASSPFLPLAGLLAAILILVVACGAIFLLLQRDGGDETISLTSTAVAIANATTLAQNAQVTQTLIALTEEAGRATDTPEPTETEAPTETPPPAAGPSDTPVVPAGEATEEVEPGDEGTGGGELGPTPTTAVIAGGDGGATGGGGALPETGVGLAGALAIAVGLFFLFIVARRLRTG